MRPLRDIVDELATYAPEGGDTWQNVGVRAVPVRLLTELKQRLDHDAWDGFEEWFAEERGHPILLDVSPVGDYVNAAFEYAGAWKFEP